MIINERCSVLTVLTVFNGLEKLIMSYASADTEIEKARHALLQLMDVKERYRTLAVKMYCIFKAVRNLETYEKVHCFYPKQLLTMLDTCTDAFVLSKEGSSRRTSTCLNPRKEANMLSLSFLRELCIGLPTSLHIPIAFLIALRYADMEERVPKAVTHLCENLPSYLKMQKSKCPSYFQVPSIPFSVHCVQSKLESELAVDVVHNAFTAFYKKHIEKCNRSSLNLEKCTLLTSSIRPCFGVWRHWKIERLLSSLLPLFPHEMLVLLCTSLDAHPTEWMQFLQNTPLDLNAIPTIDGVRLNGFEKIAFLAKSHGDVVSVGPKSSIKKEIICISFF